MLSRLKGIETESVIKTRNSVFDSLCICFPVWRELKQCLTNFRGVLLHYFVYAFPFEGNWNDFLTHWRTGRSCHALYMLSRLKGIETNPPEDFETGPSCLCICFPVWRELKRFIATWLRLSDDFVYAFPFEGNWNIIAYVCLMFSHN